MPTACCPSCDAKFDAPNHLAGRTVKCPVCSNPVLLPAADDGIETIQATPPTPAAYAPPPPPLRRPERAARDDASDWDDDDSRDAFHRDIGRRHASSANGLAIAGLVLGIVGVIMAFIPCIGWLFAIVMGIIGATLSGIGLSSAAKLGSGKGMAIAGLVLSIIAILWAPVWIFVIVGSAARTVQQAVQQAAQNQQFQFQPIEPQGLPTPAIGKLNLINGQATEKGNLALNDPKDRVQGISPCKVYTIAMTAGKTYQIDLIRTNNQIGFDPFLRLEDSAGKQLNMDDDGGGNLNSRLMFACNQTGEYRIVATSLGGQAGNFTLQVSER